MTPITKDPPRSSDIPIKDIVEYILNLFDTQGFQEYLGEPVSQREHALQAADLARREHAPPALIAAALLHDIGHLLPADNLLAFGDDTRHEERAASWLSRSFGPDVTEPIRLHVAAKRYLCTTEIGYLNQLSSGSRHSLALQGGLLSHEDVAAFERDPHFESAIRVRRWDEEAKVPGASMPNPRTYAAILKQLLLLPNAT